LRGLLPGFDFRKSFFQLLSLRVLRLDLLQDGAVGVGVFPDEVCVPLLLEDGNGVAQGND
jgi:hypothetical protein